MSDRLGSLLFRFSGSKRRARSASGLPISQKAWKLALKRTENHMHRHPVNLAEKLSEIQDYWSPRIVGELNGQQVKLAKVKGTFVWHRHQNEDELFLVLEGVLNLELRDRTVTLRPGEFFIVPKGVEHRPVAEEEVYLLMFEPASTLNTGNVRNERTVDSPRRI